MFWAKHKLLLVADLHLGKDAAFRQGGYAVPCGANTDTLHRLSAALHGTQAEQLIVLGDMFHARSSLTSEVQETVSQFIAAHRAAHIVLVRGNHDRGVHGLPQDWRLQIVPEQITIDGINLRHDPRFVGHEHSSNGDTRIHEEGSYAGGIAERAPELTLCGHIHPAIRLGERYSAERLPCFWLTRNRLVFPAFGDFTGTSLVQPRSADSIWAIVDEQLIRLSPGIVN